MEVIISYFENTDPILELYMPFIYMGTHYWTSLVFL